MSGVHLRVLERHDPEREATTSAFDAAPYCLQPTHEECVTELVANGGVLARRQLPVKVYQVCLLLREVPASSHLDHAQIPRRAETTRRFAASERVLHEGFVHFR